MRVATFIGIFIILLGILIPIAIRDHDNVGHLIDFVIAFVVDALICDTLVIAIMNCNCTPNLKRWISRRGYALAS